jgi:hypothetical protein
MFVVGTETKVGCAGEILAVKEQDAPLSSGTIAPASGIIEVP